jgi:large repetitive protein
MKSLWSVVYLCLLSCLLASSSALAAASNLSPLTNVTLTGNVLFSSLDGSAQDADGVANGVFTVNGDLIVDGTINCNDDSVPGGAGACPVNISVSGDLTIRAGSGIFAENRRAAGAGGSIALTVGGNLTLQGPSGTLPGAVVSSSRLTNAAKPAGSITFMVHGNTVLEAGSTVAASTPNGAAGTIGITSDGTVSIAGLVASGPSRQVLGTKLTGSVLDGGKGAQTGGAIVIRSHSSAGTGILVAGGGIVVSQGEATGSQMVLLEGCGIEVRGLVASILKRDGPSQVVLRSGKGILVDGRDLGSSGSRGGRVRADGVDGGAVGSMVDLFAQGDIQVLGPDPASSLFAVSSSPGTQSQGIGGAITGISLAGALSAAGNAFDAGRTSPGDRGGSIDLRSAGNATLDGATLRATGDSATSSSARKGGSLAVRSYQGALSWTFGVGDVRPVGSGAPSSAQGTINLTACSGIDITGSQFPTVGSALLPFPVENSGACSPAAPSLPSGEPPLPVCNRPPAANSQTVTTDEDTPVTITLTGSDPDGNPLTFAIVTPPAHGSLGLLTSPTATSVQVVYTPAADYNGPDSFTFQVDDGNGGTSTATVTLNVTPVNDAPKVNAATFTLNENSPNGTAVGTVTFTDPDVGQAHTFAITAGNTGGAFAINPATGQITVANSAAVDFETTPAFSLTVQVTDDGTPALSGTGTITINLINLNDPPVVNPATFSLPENSASGTAVGTVTFTDQDAGQTHTFAITAGNTGGAFAINPATGAITVANGAALDFETTPNFALTVQVTDNGTPALSGTATVIVHLLDVNEAPVVSSASFTIDENSSNGTTVGTVTFTDPDAGQTHTFAITAGNTGGAFAISATGVITVANSAALDFETTPAFTLTVQVTDNGAPALSGTATITIHLNDVNEAPVVSSATFSIAENSANGTAVGTVNFTDPDAGQTHAFAITAGNTGGAFAINPSTGAITVANGAALDFETTPAFTLTVQVTDSGVPALSGVATITINLINVNEAPVVSSATFAVDENSPLGTTVGVVTFTDPDAGQAHTFAITSGNTGGAFAINPSTGAITVAGAIDFETVPAYSLTVQVTDNGVPALSGTATITIAVNNLPEPPVANPDSFDAVGNTLLQVGASNTATGPHVFVTGNLLANDVDQDVPSTLTTSLSSASPGAQVTVNSDGTFTYLPPPGATGPTDTFTYNLTDGTFTVTGTVTITLHNRVWFVKDDAEAGGLGRSADPFNTLAAAEAASQPGDIIFVFRGDTGTAPLSGGITLKDGQKLWGEGIGLTVPGFGTLVPAGSKPRIANTSGDVVLVPATAGNQQNVEVRGLDLQASGNAVKVNSTGANVVGVTISDNDITAAGLNGVNLTEGGTGAFTATLGNNAIAATGNGFDARTTAGAGTLTIGFSNNAVSSNATGILIDGSAGGTTWITNFANNAVSPNNAGTGVSITGARFDATPGGAYQTVSGGTTVIGASGNGVGGSGLVLGSVSGDLAFTNLQIFADGGSALSLTGTGAVNTGAGTGTRVTVGAGVGIFEAIGGPAVNASNATIDLQLASLKSTNSAAAGVSLDTVTGAFSAGSGSSITNAVGTAFNVNAGMATISYDGTITNSAGRSVSITNKTSGSTTFNGAITDTGAGIFLNGNTGSTIAFTKQLSLTTGANDAFTATGGGTVIATDTTSTITTTTGTALNVQNTTIGASGLKLASVSAGTAASGPASGIVLNNTGTSGGLTVNGGTIQKTTSHGVSLISTLSPTFNAVTIKNTGGSGIKGTGVTNFSFTNGTIDTTGSGTDESNIAFNTAVAGMESNISGTLIITGSSLTSSVWHGVDVQNFSGTLDTVTIAANTITSPTSTATSRGSGIRLQALGSATTAANVTKATISNNVISNFPSGAGILAQGGNSNASGPAGMLGVAGSASSIVSITGNQIQGQSPVSRMGTSAIIAAVSGKGQGSFDISSNGTVANPLTNVAGTAILCGGNGNTTSTFTVSNNVIVANNTVASNGVGGGTGVTFGTSDTPDMTWTIANNSISATDGNGILTVARGGTGNLKVKIQNNTVAAPLSGVRQGIRVDAGNGSSVNDSVCLNISGNTSAGSGGTTGIGLRKQGTVSTTNAFGISGMAATTTPGVEAYVNGLNPAGNGTLLLSATSGFSNCSLP